MTRVLILLFVLFALAVPSTADAKISRLSYGELPKHGKTYTVVTSVFGCTSWDDNGIGYYGGIDLFKAKWVVAELGMGSALGGLGGGAYLKVSYGNRAAVVVTGDIGSGHNHYQLDLHCGVARHLGVLNNPNFREIVRIERLPRKAVRLTPWLVNRGIPAVGAVQVGG